MTILWILIFLIVLGTMLYHRIPLWLGSILILGLLVGMSYFSLLHWLPLSLLWVLCLPPIVFLNIKPLRRNLLTKYVLNLFRRSQPSLSETEKQALTVGTVGWEGELFTGKPNWSKIINYPKFHLSDEEQAFLDGPVEELCQMIDNWEFTHQLRYIPDPVWKFIKEKGFFGMIIPKSYGGKEFSALAHSAVLMKVGSCSSSVATVVSVPNSLGPGELLLKYGTEDQKNYYLPRLARGEEVPAFALTSPHAGSDATAIMDYGVICEATFQGKQQLCIRLNWDKRYITLAPVATLLGLAFKLYDPDHLLGEREKLGITCALVPTNLTGVTIGRRHFPLDSPFPNGPTQGKDVIIPIDWIIGGRDRAGQGWAMLIECLSVGRAISLPALFTGGAKIGVYTTGAYARIRKQFGQPIGNFEGIEAPLGRIGGLAYIMNAVREFTLSAIDRGEKPAVPAGITKCYTTELGRQGILDVMDIHAGKAICMGPSNYMAQGYEEMPICITVEGANILTRSMMIFGQGAIRCHPYLLDELQASQDEDVNKGLKDFDQALFKHIGFTLSNFVRSLWLGLTQGRCLRTPGGLKKPQATRRHYQQITRMSASFALLADMTLLTLGGALKRKEHLSGRFADILSYLYMASAVLKHFENEQADEILEPVLHWSCQYLLHHTQQQMDRLLSNFPNRGVARILRWFVFPLGRRFSPPSDVLYHQIAQALLQPNGLRARLAETAYTTPGKNNPAGNMEVLLKQIVAVADIEKRFDEAVKKGDVEGYSVDDRIQDAINKKVLTQKEADQLLKAFEARMQAIQVDDFSIEALTRTK